MRQDIVMAQMFAVNDLDVPKVCACIRCTAGTRSPTHVEIHVIVCAFISPALLMHPPAVPLQRVHALSCAQVLLFYAPQMEGMAQRIAKVSQCVQLCNIRSAPLAPCPTLLSLRPDHVALP